LTERREESEVILATAVYSLLVLAGPLFLALVWSIDRGATLRLPRAELVLRRRVG
jgi:hypothetical protein